MYKINWLFPSCFKPPFQSEMIWMKLICYSHASRTRDRKKEFKLSLACLKSESFWNSEIHLFMKHTLY